MYLHVITAYENKYCGLLAREAAREDPQTKPPGVSHLEKAASELLQARSLLLAGQAGLCCNPRCAAYCDLISLMYGLSSDGRLLLHLPCTQPLAPVHWLALLSWTEAQHMTGWRGVTGPGALR